MRENLRALGVHCWAGSLEGGGAAEAQVAVAGSARGEQVSGSGLVLPHLPPRALAADLTLGAGQCR